LAAKGIHMVQGDLDNPESYAKYLDGVHSAFVNADCKRPSVLPHLQYRTRQTTLLSVFGT
jgi:hypothetical protein